MEDLDHLKPRTVDGIKRLARQLKNRDGIAYYRALQLAAKQAGWPSFESAQRNITRGTGVSDESVCAGGNQ